MKPAEIRKILKLARQFGVKEMTMGGFAVSFHTPRVKKKDKRVSTSSLSQGQDALPDTPAPQLSEQELTSEGLPTYDELLVMSTPFYDQMQEFKRLQDEGDDHETQSVN